MSEPIRIQQPNKKDIPALKRLWIETFGDDSALVDAFMDIFPPESCGWIVCRGQEILSSAYLLRGNAYAQADARLPAEYVYAVATPVAHRGNGYAGILMHHFESLAAKDGALLYTRPASTSLFDSPLAEMRHLY